MSTLVVKTDKISKRYIINHQRIERHDTLRDTIVKGVKGLFVRDSHIEDYSREDFWALRDISFEINQGDRVGIIGRNGAGKSTLLKILSRITEPTNGRITLKGRVASLLEVGTGFHPELTGRENIFLNGAILGMSRQEIRKKFHEIVAFAEVERFLDTPVKRYSSGMYVRLAFAVAAHLEPEILIVDEVLAVGDAQFQKKCLGKMQDVSVNQGRTVLFVSHNMMAMQALCTKGILMEKGNLVSQGNISETISTYLKQFTEGKRKIEWDWEQAPGNDTAKFLRAEIRPCNVSVASDLFLIDQELEIEFLFYNQRKGDTALDITFHLTDEMGHLVFVGSSGYQFIETKIFGPGEIKAVCKLPVNVLHEGSYNISRLLLVQDRGLVVLEVKDVVQFEIVENQEEQWGWKGAKEGVIRPLLEWQFNS